MTQDEINQREWADRKNWSVLTYTSSQDTRLFVPKGRGLGWTINFGHAGGKYLFGAFMALPVIIFFAVWCAGAHLGKK